MTDRCSRPFAAALFVRPRRPRRCATPVLLAVAAVALALPGATEAAAGEAPDARIGPGTIRIDGLPPGASGDRLAVTRSGRPVGGTAGRAAGAIVFRPRFPVLPGTRSRVRPAGIGEWPPRLYPDGAAPKILAVKPAGEVVAEDLLRFRVGFSRPMAPGDAARRVRVETAAGVPVRAISKPPREFRDPAESVLTLVVRPAMVKTGLAADAARERPRAAGGRSRLVMEAGRPDRPGGTTAARPVRPFSVGAAETRRIDPGRWATSGIATGTTTPLTVRFGRPLDPLLLPTHLRVVGPDGPVPGRAQGAPRGTAWRFMPAAPWGRGPFRLEVHPALEDRAGNRLAAPFDHRVGAERAAAAISLPLPAERRR